MADELGVMVCIEDVRNAVTDGLLACSMQKSVVSVLDSRQPNPDCASDRQMVEQIRVRPMSMRAIRTHPLGPNLLDLLSANVEHHSGFGKRSGQRGSGASARDPLTMPTAVGSTRSNKTALRVGIVASLAVGSVVLTLRLGSRIRTCGWPASHGGEFDRIVPRKHR